MKETVVAWLVSLMVWIAPPDKIAALPAYPGWAETAEERSTRYESIASDLYDVTFDERVQPAFSGSRGRFHTSTLLLAIAYKESGFTKDVDIGPCYQGKLGQRCDGGQSACLMQIKTGRLGTTHEGYTQSDLFADRKKCFGAALALVKRSIRACRKEGPDFVLNAYASGVCGLGYQQSRERIGLGRRMYARGGADLARVVLGSRP